jgi:hypothetical protein
MSWRYWVSSLQPVCDEAAKERHTPVGTLRALVENEVQKLLPHGKAGASYEQVVDQLRRSLALQYCSPIWVPRTDGNRICSAQDPVGPNRETSHLSILRTSPPPALRPMARKIKILAQDRRRDGRV